MNVSWHLASCDQKVVLGVPSPTGFPQRLPISGPGVTSHLTARVRGLEVSPQDFPSLSGSKSCRLCPLDCSRMCPLFSVSSHATHTKSFSSFCAWTFARAFQSAPHFYFCSAPCYALHSSQGDPGTFLLKTLQGPPTAFRVDSRPSLGLPRPCRLCLFLLHDLLHFLLPTILTSSLLRKPTDFLPPQGLCTCCSFGREHYSPRSVLSQLLSTSSFHVLVSEKSSLAMLWRAIILPQSICLMSFTNKDNYSWL